MAATPLNPPAPLGMATSKRSGQLSASAIASSPLDSLGYQLTLLYIVLLVGRVPEITAYFLGSSLYQVLVVTMVLLSLAIITGILVTVGATRIGLFWIAFHLWVMVTLPLSGYRRGSLETLGFMMKYLPAIFFVGGYLSRNTQSVRRGLWAMGLAGTIALIWTIYSGALEDDDRFVAVGTFSNSNELAIYLLLMLPLWLFIVSNGRYKWVVRGFFLALSLYAMATVLKTGSRSGLMTFGVLAVPFFFSLSVSSKLKLVLLSSVTVVGVIAFAPEGLKNRWATIFSDKVKATDESAAAAVGSTEARYALLIESLQTTIKHPILGTGIGVYADVNAQEKQGTGKKALWQVTHNAYTQVSAETGIPGLILYMTALYLSIRELWRVRRLGKTNPKLQELGMIATALLYSYVSFCFNGLFTSMATQFTIYTLAGFSIAVGLTAQKILDETNTPDASLLVPAATGPVAGSSRFFPRLAPAPAPAVPAASESEVTKNSDAPWRRNPRKYPPKLGAPSR